MSRRTLFALTAAVAALAVYFAPMAGSGTPAAFAEDCTPANTGTLVIRIVDIASDDPIWVEGTQVLIKPDPRDFELDEIVVDTALSDASASGDSDSDPGVIRVEDVCSTEGSEAYVASVWSLPDDLEDCEIVNNSDSTTLDPEDTENLTLEVDCAGVGATATPVPSATRGPAATVQTNAQPLAVGCNGTSVINVTVRDASGNPVQTGTTVSISASIGSVSPSSGFVTGSNGTVFAFYTAPASSGGTAVVTASAGSASGTANVTVNCGAGGGSTVTPPPTVGAGGGGVIRPPNTGDGGLMETDRDDTAFALAFLVITLAGLKGSLRSKQS